MSSRALVSTAVVAWVMSSSAIAQVVPDATDASRLLRVLQADAEGRLLSASGGGAMRLGSGPHGGLLFGIDVGGASPLPFGGVEPGLGFGLSAKLGYQALSGLSMALEYDDLGLTPAATAADRFQFGTFAMRYTFPYPIPMPYLEAASGVAVITPPGPLGSQGESSFVAPGGALGLGISIPLSHHVAIDVGLRDWIAPAAGTLLQVLSLEAGLDLTVGGAARHHRSS